MHLTAFGDTKLWPLYLFFGNDSKYLRCKPTSHLCKHVTYFIKVGGSCGSHYISSLLFIQFLQTCSSWILSRSLPQVRWQEAVHQPLHSQHIALRSSCTNSGKLCLMMSSWKHGSMELSSCAPMEFYDSFIHKFSPILWTIQKSEFHNSIF